MKIQMDKPPSFKLFDENRWNTEIQMDRCLVRLILYTSRVVEGGSLKVVLGSVGSIYFGWTWTDRKWKTRKQMIRPGGQDLQFTFFRGQQVHVNPHPSSHVSRLVSTWHVNRRETWTRREPEPTFGVNFHVSCRFTFHVGSRRFTFWNLDLHFWGILAWTFMFFF